MIPPPRPSPGTPIITWANRLADYIASLRVTAGPGILLRQSSSGTIISAEGTPGSTPVGKHAFRIGKAKKVGDTIGKDWITISPGTISSTEAKIGTEFLSSHDANGQPPMLDLPAGRHIIGLKITWEPVAYDVNEGITGEDPLFMLGAGGSCTELEIVHEPEDDWQTMVDTETVWPSTDEAGTITDGILFQRIGIVELTPEGDSLRATLGNPRNDGLRSSANGTFCPPKDYKLIPL